MMWNSTISKWDYLEIQARSAMDCDKKFHFQLKETGKTCSRDIKYHNSKKLILI